MCFYNSMSKKAKELAARYNRKVNIIESVSGVTQNYRIAAFTDPDCAVVTSGSEIQAYKWGLIPFLTRTEKDASEIRRMTYNAKAETVFSKPSFRESIKRHRCLIPSTGYFEWRHEGDDKIPYYIFLKNEPVFSIAGIYDVWDNPVTGEAVYTFSMITTEANPLTAYIHNAPRTGNRMPAILSREEEETWLDPGFTQEEIKALLKPFDADRMDAYVIRKDFLKKNPFDPSVLERAGTA